MPSGPWLVTGGAGYIGAHVVRALQSSGRRVVVLDDLSSGDATRLPPQVELVPGSVADVGLLTATLRRTSPTGVLHLAAKKSPTESVSDPLLYARENVGGVMALLEALRMSECRNVVFSSSSSVYGNTEVERVSEDAPRVPTSPYGESKLYGQQLLAAAAEAYGLGPNGTSTFASACRRPVATVFWQDVGYTVHPQGMAHAVRRGEREYGYLVLKYERERRRRALP